MIVKIIPGNISGSIMAPASKSSMQRSCAAALLNEGETIIENPGRSNDDLAALDVIANLGAAVTATLDNLLTVRSSGVNPVTGDMNCGESGLGIRMFAPIAALSNEEITINGTGSLLTRPMDFFDTIFPQLGITINSNQGRLPIKIKGPLQPVDITIDGSLSSQFLTGLLMAYGKATTKPVTITVTNLKSKPYIDLTLEVMKHFGYNVINNGYESFEIFPVGELMQQPVSYTVEGDWSGAAFLLVAGAIAGEITIKGLDVFSAQADKAILHALSMAETVISIEEKQIVIGPGKLKAFHFDATDCPDLFPPLVALASYCDGTTVIEGVRRLAHKESNRGLTLQDEFGKMGIAITLQDDLMLIKGGSGVHNATVHSHHDHRIAMACAVAGLKANGEIIIEEAEAINKSYPDFYDHLEKLGANINTMPDYSGIGK
ncbi:MAG: 3-phosphoshikimate 1-carboxyvinyltransferase [Ferruginibacter sp.]